MTGRETPGFSFPVKVGHVSANPLTVTLAADEKECAALASLWGVVAVDSFEAEAHLTRWKRDGVRVKGTLRAGVVQESVVSLEQVESTLEEPFELVFVPEGSRLSRIDTSETGEVVVDPDGADIPETFSGDTIDVGAAVAEFAALALEPYPRKDGEAFEPHVEDRKEDNESESPFAVLKRLRADDDET